MNFSLTGKYFFHFWPFLSDKMIGGLHHHKKGFGPFFLRHIFVMNMMIISCFEALFFKIGFVHG